MGTEAIASTGYRLVAAVLAEQTNGIIASWDGAFDKHNVETAEEFLQWWGDEQIARYGLEALLIDCAVELVNPRAPVSFTAWALTSIACASTRTEASIPADTSLTDE